MELQMSPKIWLKIWGAPKKVKIFENTHDWNNDKPYECGLETLDIE